MATTSPTATASPSVGPSPSPTLSPALPPPGSAGFVRASGVNLVLGGSPYRFIGFDIYNANSRWNCWYPLGYEDGALDDALSAVGPGQAAFRAWFYQDLATTSGARDWAAFDHTLSVARAHGERVIATLADQWGSCDSGPGTATYKTDSWYESGYRTMEPWDIQSYRDYVAAVVARYRDDPTILAWQLMNEAEVKPSEDSIPCTADAAAVLKTWAADMSALVKSIDLNHLVSLGTIGTGQCGTSGSDYQYVHDLPTIDLCEYHDYQPDAMPGDQWNGLTLRLSQAATLGKPMFVGESGQKDMSLPDRAALFSSKFSTQFGAGVVGELVWALRTDAYGGSSTTDYDVGPSDPTVSLFSAY